MERKLKSLVISPFDPAGMRVRDTIQRAFEEEGYHILRVDGSESRGASLINAITDAIRASDVILFDVSRQNPNVFYELGIAHGLGKQTILLLSDESTGSLPSDLTGVLYWIYDPKDLRSLSDDARRFAKRFLQDYVSRGRA